jgi:hypothetical protein
LTLISAPFSTAFPHDLLLKAVAHHTSLRWVLLYIERWLKALMQMPDGTLTAREKGTPQGSPISPLRANLFMHYAFDTWMGREYPGCPFERYADDVVAHCDSEAQARELRDSIARRLGALGLELHPGKTKVVYCKDTRRRGTSEHVSFDFLGYTFRGRVVRGQRGFFVGFNPAMSDKAAKAVSQKIRAWHLNRLSATDLSGLAEDINARREAGSATTEPSTAPGCIPSHCASTSPWSGGPCRSTSDCAAGPSGPGPGWILSVRASPGSSSTGTSSRAPRVGLWEPGEGRPSRRVLREPGGAIPPGHSPGYVSSARLRAEQSADRKSTQIGLAFPREPPGGP